MKVHLITLAFIGPHRHLEAPFQAYYFQTTLRQVRIAIASAILFYAAYGIYDAIVVPQLAPLFWTIRWAIVCPACALLLWFTFSRHFFRLAQPALGLVALMGCSGIIIMSMIVPTEQHYPYIAGFVQTLFFLYLIVRMQFIWASCLTFILLIAYEASALIIGRLPFNYFISDTFFLVGIHLMCMLASYALELSMRKNFFLSRQLESKKKRLAVANQYLEKRVEKRTAELQGANEKLMIEVNSRIAMETALRDSESRYRRMVDNVTDYICVHDMNGRILEANNQMIKGLEYSQKQLAAMSIEDLMLPDKRSEFKEYIARIRRDGLVTGSVTLATRNGQQRHIEYSNVLSRHASGVEVIYSLCRDVTDGRRAERALAQSQARFKNIFETAAAGMMIVDDQTQTITEVNPAAAQMIGETTSEIQGRPFKQLIQPAADGDKPAICKPSSQPTECELITRHGHRLPILKTMQPMELNDRSHWIVSFVNIQSIKEAENAKRNMEMSLNRAQHLQAIGTLAGGIAHDFNNILYGMIGYTELALDDAPEGSLLQANINEILKGGQRAKELITQILTFSRQDSAEKKKLQPAPLVKEALKLLRASIPATIDIRTEFANQTDWIEANPTQIHQVVMNLCTNAAHAVQTQGSRLQVRLDQTTVVSDEITRHGVIPQGTYVRLTVSDDGCGIPHEIIDRIYEPFFTTKPQGQGSGMGLSVVLGIVKAHGGALRLNSKAGCGTQFEIFLPAVCGCEEPESTRDVALPKGVEHILFVDDEKSIVQMGRRTLSGLGYRITACNNPQKALALFRKQPLEFDLVITDLTMPHCRGTHLARELLKIRPNVPVILITGNGNEISKDQLAKLGIRELLSKPILRHELAQSIRRALTESKNLPPLINDERQKPGDRSAV